MPLPQTTKELALRIDPRYIRRRSSMRVIRGLLSFLLVAGAICYWVVGGPRARHAMVNPGHLSAAHAMWENNCAACHDGDGFGGYRKTVSDAACLQCHGAPAHHPNQLLRIGVNAHNAMALAVKDDQGRLGSANCTACHVEHKGRALLATVEDATCTKCHVNIEDAINPRGTRPADVSVTAFNATGGHPYFGRELLRPDAELPVPWMTFDPSTLFDPTHLKFNHSRHMTGDADPAHGAGVNCTTCHVNRDRGPAETEVNRSIEPSSPGDGRYMRPIRYARDCEDCHKLALPGGAALPHVAMNLVQDRLLHLEEFYRDWLAHQPPAQRAEVLGDKEPEQWVKDSASSLRSAAGDWIGGLEKAKKMMEGAPRLEEAVYAQFSLEAGSAVEPAIAGQDIRVLSAYVAYAPAFSSRCAKCHDVREPGVAKAAQSQLATAPAEAAVPATQPAGPVAAPALATVPTGIPASPRHWFVNSRFDHQAHQNVTCESCHARARASTQTSDVLSPNLSWTVASGVTVSCADCHHPTNSTTGRGAGSSCVTCHNFHDHSLPTAPAQRRDILDVLRGNSAAPATQPVASAGK